MLRETSYEDCQPMNETFYRNRYVICHFNLTLYDIPKRYEKTVNEENLDKRRGQTFCWPLVTSY